MKVKKLYELVMLSAVLLGFSVGSAWAAGEGIKFVIKNTSGESVYVLLEGEGMVGPPGDVGHSEVPKKAERFYGLKVERGKSEPKARLAVSKGQSRLSQAFSCYSGKSIAPCKMSDSSKIKPPFEFKAVQQVGYLLVTVTVN